MMMRRVGSVLAVALLSFAIYIVYTGSISPYDLATGAIVALIVGALFSGITVKTPVKLINPARWGYLVLYAIKYFVYYETLAHLDVISRILHPKTPVNPAVVMAPFDVETDYALTTIANSITNTPGTVVVDVDEKRRVFYIHWIDAKTLDPLDVKKRVFEDFEKYAKRIFD